MKPPRSNTTLSTPAALARSATSRPTVAAAETLPVSPAARTSGSRVEAAARVRPEWSSITWTTVCRLDRNTARRGRVSEPRTFLRTRRCRRSRASCFCLALYVMFAVPASRPRRPCSLAGLAGLAHDALAGVADALALVGLGLADLADVGRHLAHRLLVDPGDDDAGGGRHLEGDAVRGLDEHRVAEAEGQVDPGGP